VTTPCPYGFRIVGGTWEARRLVDAGAAFAGTVRRLPPDGAALRRTRRRTGDRDN